jgi:predicted dehydrogenase
MNPTPRPSAPPAGNVNRRDFILGTVAAGATIGGGLGAFYFGYDRAVGSPLRVGVLGTGDEGGVLLGAINPEYLEVKAIADIRPYNVWRAFHGDYSTEEMLTVRPGLIKKYGWRTESEARRHVKVYGRYEDLIAQARADGLEAVVIALPLHLHAPAAIAAMHAGLHVLTEKLMAHSVHECKEMARVAERTGRILAVGHQRHYSILYANAAETIRRGTLGRVHYIRAQWNRGNLPGTDSWQQPMPRSVKPDDPQAGRLLRELKSHRAELAAARGAAIELWRKRVEQVEAQIRDETVNAEDFDYRSTQLKDGAGKVVYHRPAIEELIRWRLWDRTGAGLMAELGSHQLDAARIFIAAAHGGEEQLPLSVAAAADRPLFPADRDIEDHVYCIVEFPAPGYDPNNPVGRLKKIGVQYSSINGNGFGGYGEIVYGTEGTLILEREQELQIVRDPKRAPSGIHVSGGGGPTLDTQASGAPTAVAKTAGGGPKVSRGYAEELEHWAWCVRNPAPENKPHCGPEVAMGDAILALTANMAARRGTPIEFKKEWFDVHRDETPEGVGPA